MLGRMCWGSILLMLGYVLVRCDSVDVEINLQLMACYCNAEGSSDVIMLCLPMQKFETIEDMKEHIREELDQEPSVRHFFPQIAFSHLSCRLT